MTTIGELKFACPVCHQHIVCDLGAAGSQIECPTCFQPVIVPKSASHAAGKIILHARQPKARLEQLTPKINVVLPPAKKRKWWLTIMALGGLLLVGGAVFAISH